MTGPRHASAFVTLPGLALLSVGAVVLAGWTLQIEVLVRMPPGARAMQGIAAAGFVLMGAGLLAAAAGRRLLQGAAGALCSVLALPRLAALFTPLPPPRLWGLDPTGGMPPVSTMAPNSAVVFLFGGIGLFLLAARTPSAARRLGAAVAVGVVVLVGGWDLALLVLEEQLLEVPLGGQMAPQMAVGALLGGVALAALVRDSTPADDAALSRLPVTLGLLGLVLTLVVTASIRMQQQELVGRMTEVRLAQFERDLQAALEERRAYLGALGWAVRAPEPPDETLQEQYRARYSDALAVRVLPAGTPELRGRLSPLVPSEQAGRSGAQVTLVSSIPEGGSALAVHDLAPLMSAVLSRGAPGYELVVRRGDDVAVRTAALLPGSTLFVKRAPVLDPGEEWTVDLWPDAEERNRLRAPVAMAGLLMGILLSYLLALSALGQVAARARSEELATALAELSATRRQLAEAEKMDALGRMAGGIAHDFNNLLTVIQGHVGLLQEDPGLPSGARSQLAEVEQSAEHAAALTQQLLTFTARGVESARPFDPGRLVRSWAPLLQEAVGPAVTLDLSGCEAGLTVRGNPETLRAALVALATNAGQAMPDGGRLEISVGPRDVSGTEARRHLVLAGSYVAVAVRDDGEGMAPEVRERMFEPFFSTRNPSRSAGLGLAAVYGFAKQHGGGVAVVSEPGRGTTVEILLPRTTEADDGA